MAAAVAIATPGCGSAPSQPASASKQSANASNGSSGSSQQGGSGAQAAPTKILATVSATGQATLTDSAGRLVTRLPSGWYSVYVTVNAVGADFRLDGPSVDSATKSKVPGVALWGVHLLKGTYRYTNDRAAHSGTHVLSVY